MRPDLEAPTSVFAVFFIQLFVGFCLFFSLLYGATELTLFALFIHTMGLVAYLWSKASLKHVECKITVNRTRLFPGAKLKVDIWAINSKLLPTLFKVNLLTPGAIAGTDKDHWINEEISLLWFQQFVFSREFFPNKRGVYNLGPPLLRVGDSFGFFRKKKEFKEQSEIIVYPRIINIRPVPFPKREFFGIQGAWSPVEDPIFVFGTRDYQPGRPARRIQWKVSARHNRLQEKLCDPAEQEKLLILFDVDQFDNEQVTEDFERSVEVIASLALQMSRRGIAVGFATNGFITGGGPHMIPISRGTQQMDHILESLARIDAKRFDTLTDILSLSYQLPWGVSSIYFAYKRGPQLGFAKAYMKQRSIPMKFVVAQKSSNIEITDGLKDKDIVHLDDILVPENL